MFLQKIEAHYTEVLAITETTVAFDKLYTILKFLNFKLEWPSVLNEIEQASTDKNMEKFLKKYCDKIVTNDAPILWTDFIEFLNNAKTKYILYKKSGHPPEMLGCSKYPKDILLKKLLSKR